MSEDIKSEKVEASTEATAEKEVKSPAPQRSNERVQRTQKPQREQRNPRFRRKACRFCQDKDAVIDYKKTEILERFITDRGKILPRRVTGTCAKHQRHVAIAIKRARVIALLPFVDQ